MKNKIFISGLVLFALICGIYFFIQNRANNIKRIANEMEAERLKTCVISGAKENLTEISIKPCDALNMSVTITGKLKGNYFFEGSAPIRLEDEKGNVLLRTHLNATTEWMTTGDVSFNITIDSNKLPGGMANLIIERDDPSGESKNLMPIKIPIFID